MRSSTTSCAGEGWVAGCGLQMLPGFWDCFRYISFSTVTTFAQTSIVGLLGKRGMLPALMDAWRCFGNGAATPLGSRWTERFAYCASSSFVELKAQSTKKRVY